MTITADTIIGDILDFDASLEPILLNVGMHCLFCPSAKSETIGQACDVHGVNCEELVAALNSAIKAGE